jgi:hypothetical protein
MIKRIIVINLALLSIQALTAGSLMSGSELAVRLHKNVGLALELGAFIQAVTAIVLWRRHRVPPVVAGTSFALFVLMALQAGLGFGRQYWLHVPLGVALFGALVRQAERLDRGRSTPAAG